MVKGTRGGGIVAEKGSFSGKDYHDPPPAPFIDPGELTKWSFYLALIAEFIATLFFLYIGVLTIIGYKHQTDPSLDQDMCGGVGLLGIAWAFGGMIFILVYCNAGISGGHINPVVTFGLFLACKVSLIRAIMYMVAQCLGAICRVGLVKDFQKSLYTRYDGGDNSLADDYNTGVRLSAEIIGTFVLVYTVFSATAPLIPKQVPDIVMSLYWHHFQLDLPYLWSLGHHSYHRHRYHPC